ncbi:MAG: glycogen/starch synthase [Candidatus Taylorbacteria bacterium]|nr:glycogen/starch synthase [Candidatus Taylorbacteria bacterium]
MKKNKGLKILFVATEAAPFIKIGGLGEVMYALPKALRELGHDARVLMPKYASIPSEKYKFESHIDGINIPSGSDRTIICNIKILENASPPLNYFLENQEFFEQRGSVYGYDDDSARFSVLCRGALEFIKANTGKWTPDIIVASDWQGGLIPNLVKTEYSNDPIISTIATVFSIHNLCYQGMFDHHHINELDYDDGQSSVPSLSDPRLLKTSFMRRGIRYADVVNTVSPSYAQEITTPEYGELLDAILQERRSRVFGILNGIDYVSNDPQANPHVEFKYSLKSLKDRDKNKTFLQKKFNLEENPDVPIFAIVSRLSEQKGLDLVVDMIEPLLNNYKFQLIILGTGESRYLSYFADLDKRYEQVATHLSFDTALPHVIFAGADVIMIPSRFEPSGLTQMEAMRYGALPLVRKTGGLADSVENYSPILQTGTGFVFEKYDKHAFFGAVVQAIETYKYEDNWKGIQKRAMSTNFSWVKSAKEYIELFKKAINFNKESKE